MYGLQIIRHHTIGVARGSNVRHHTSANSASPLHLRCVLLQHTHDADFAIANSHAVEASFVLRHLACVHTLQILAISNYYVHTVVRAWMRAVSDNGLYTLRSAALQRINALACASRVRGPPRSVSPDESQTNDDEVRPSRQLINAKASDYGICVLVSDPYATDHSRKSKAVLVKKASERRKLSRIPDHPSIRLKSSCTQERVSMGIRAHSESWVISARAEERARTSADVCMHHHRSRRDLVRSQGGMTRQVPSSYTAAASRKLMQHIPWLSPRYWHKFFPLPQQHVYSDKSSHTDI